MTTFFVNIWDDVKNVNGTRFVKTVASVSTEDNGINNSLVHSFVFGNKDDADKFCENVNKDNWK